MSLRLSGDETGDLLSDLTGMLYGEKRCCLSADGGGKGGEKDEEDDDVEAMAN